MYLTNILFLRTSEIHRKQRHDVVMRFAIYSGGNESSEQFLRLVSTGQIFLCKASRNVYNATCRNFLEILRLQRVQKLFENISTKFLM